MVVVIVLGGIRNQLEPGMNETLKGKDAAEQRLVVESELEPPAVLPDNNSEMPAIAKTIALTTEQSELNAALGRLSDSDDSNNPHAFVVMPFGEKSGPDGKVIDFDAVYHQLIKPSLIEARFKPFRADEESVSGDILTDMFQELLLADLVIADLSIDNANVFYELGVRHAFRKRGVVHIQSGRDYMPFDVFNVRTMPYHVSDDGRPDEKHIERDKKNLIRITSETWASDTEAVHSPIFGLLTGLVEPDRRALRTPLATNFWREFNEWEERIAIARRQKRIGDILLLTEEISNPLCKEDAVAQAGMALRELGRHELALQEYRKGLAVNPRNVEFRREEAVILNRMGRVDEAIIKLERLLEDEPSDTNATGCLGRIYTSIWKNCWIHISDLEERRQAAFNAYQWLIKSIDTYLKGFHVDLNVHEPGIKALNMAGVLIELADRYDEPDDPDADVARIRDLLPELRGTLGLTLKAGVLYKSPDYWTLASLGEWHLTRGDGVRHVSRMYRKSLSYARKNVFHIQSSLKQVKLFQNLGLYEESCEAAERILSNEIKRIESGHSAIEDSEYPLPQTDKRSFLFTGHRLDCDAAEAAGRFPEDLEQEVRRQIDASLDRGNADWNDHGFVPGASCGGEIVFIEACLDRGMKVHVHMPCTDAEFINDFVGYGGESWIERFYAIRNHPKVNIYYQSERVGALKDNVDMLEYKQALSPKEYKKQRQWNSLVRNSRWTLYASLVLGIEKLKVIALWDLKSETAEDQDGQLVSGMVDHAEKMGCIVDKLNITKLEYLFKMKSAITATDPNATLQLDARVELLRNVSLFSSLHKVDLAQIALVTQEQPFADASVLARQGERGDELFIIASGEVSVRVSDEHGNDKEIARRGVGEYVGEMAIVRDEIRMATLVARGELLVLTLNQARFEKILKDRPESSLAVTKTLANRLIEASRFESEIEKIAELTC